MTAVATGTEVPGTLSADGTSWKPNGQLERATEYQIAAEAKDAKGRSATENASITTVSPANRLHRPLHPRGRLDRRRGHAGDRSTSTRRSPTRRPCSRRSQVTSSSGQQVVGHWFNDQPPGLPPRGLLEARLHRHREAASTGEGLGLRRPEKTVTFKIGRSQVSTVDAKTKQMTVVRDGKTIKTIPISSGSAREPDVQRSDGDLREVQGRPA